MEQLKAFFFDTKIYVMQLPLHTLVAIGFGVVLLFPLAYVYSLYKKKKLLSTRGIPTYADVTEKFYASKTPGKNPTIKYHFHDSLGLTNYGEARLSEREFKACKTKDMIQIVYQDYRPKNNAVLTQLDKQLSSLRFLLIITALEVILVPILVYLLLIDFNL